MTPSELKFTGARGLLRRAKWV